MTVVRLPVQAGHSWIPGSLIQRAKDPPAPPCIGGVLYPGKRTLLSGETESLKTWFALILAKAEMDAGFPVAWVDMDAMGAGELLLRLRELGCDDGQVDDMFLHYEPLDALVDDALWDFTELIQARGIRLCVLDAFNPLLALHGLNMNSTDEVETFWREVADPICRAGAAPTLLDHVTKNAETRGKYSIGTERKASGSIVHIGFRPLKTLTRQQKGSTLLYTHKDRAGYLERPVLGKLIMAPNGDGKDYRLESSGGFSTSGFRPTFLMERVSERLQLHVEPVSQRWIEENVSGQAKHLRTAVQILTDEGYLIKQPGGQGGGSVYASSKPFLESQDEPLEVRPEVRPNCVPSLVSTPLGSASPPVRGDALPQKEHQTASEVRLNHYPVTESLDDGIPF